MKNSWSTGLGAFLAYAPANPLASVVTQRNLNKNPPGEKNIEFN